MKRIVTLSAITAVTVLISINTEIRRAIATAFGADYIPSYTYSQGGFNIPVPSGYLYHLITGDDKRVEKDYAAYGPSFGAGFVNAKICNYTFIFRYYDNNVPAKNYKSLSTGTIPQCTYSAKAIAYPGTLPSYGHACAQLYVSGDFKGQQCHKIIK